MIRGDRGAPTFLAEDANRHLLGKGGGSGKGIQRDVPSIDGMTSRKLRRGSDIQQDRLGMSLQDRLYLVGRDGVGLVHAGFL